jgi:hypothetical protein
MPADSKEADPHISQIPYNDVLPLLITGLAIRDELDRT